VKKAVLTISNRLGLHARPASKLVKIASHCKGSVFLYKDGQKVNAKSILGVIMLEALMGAEVIIEADGTNEDEIIALITELVNNKFDED